MDNVNLLPSDVIARRQRFTYLRAWGVVSAVTLLVLLGGLPPLRWQLTAAERRVATLYQQHTQLGQRIDQLKVLRQQQQALRDREEIISALFSKAPLQQLFFDIATLTDEEIWLSRMQLRKAPAVGGGHTSRLPQQQRSKSFFTLGGRTAAAHGGMMNVQEHAVFLLLQGYAMSHQRLADFMSGLSAAQHLSKVSLKVARRGTFQTFEAIEFAIEIHP